MAASPLGDLLSVKAVPLQAKTPPLRWPPNAEEAPLQPAERSRGSVPARTRSLRTAFTLRDSGGPSLGRPPREASLGPGLRLVGDSVPPLGALVPRRLPTRLRSSSLETPKALCGAPSSLEPLPPAPELQEAPPAPPRPAFQETLELEELLADMEARSAAGSPAPAEATLALSGDAFAIGAALVESLEDDGFETLGEDEEGDEADDEENPDVDDWKDATEAEDLGEEEAEADDEEEEDADEEEASGLRDLLVNESDEYQPGATQEDAAGQCDDVDDSPQPLSREAPVVDEDMLMAATAPLLIDGPVKKKRKKKKKKKKRRHSKTVVVEVLAEKKPPVPRFPHPSGQRPEKEATLPLQAAQTLSERPPLRERFSKQLLLGRFPKRKPRAEGADSAAEADGETEAEKPDVGAETSAAEEPAPQTVPAPRPRRVRRARSAAEPSAAKVPTRHAGPTAEDDGTQSDADKAKTLSLAVVGSRAPKLHHRSRVVVTKSIWKEEPDFDSGLGALYFSFSSMRSADGQKVPLKNRDKVVRTLHELNSKVALPLCRHFGLRYNFFSEHHPQAKKAGVTCKEPLILRKEGPDGTEIQETRYLVTIRLRLRLHPTKGDPQTDFISRGTQVAVLLHELCHLKHMNHGKDFMLFLRDIFAYAHKLGVFDPAAMTNEIPSPWPWENVIFQRAGEVSDEELLKIFAEHRSAQRKEPSPILPEKDLALTKVTAEPEEKDIEAISTSASDAAPEPPATPPPPPPPPPAVLPGSFPSMVASFSAKGCADGCCLPPVEGVQEATEISYGEGETRLPGFDSPSPRPRLPPLVRPQLRSEPSRSPMPRSDSRLLLPPIH